MRRRLLIGVVVSMAVGVQLYGHPAIADDANQISAPVIAVIDVEKIMQDSLAAKSVRNQIEHFQQVFQDDLGADEARLRAKQQELESLRKSSSSDPAVAEKARSLDAGVAEFQRKGMARRRALEKSAAQATNQISEAMNEVTRTVATNHGANIVIPQNQLILFDEKMNITKEIIDALNKALPKVDVPAPRVDGDAAAVGAAAKKKSQ